MIFFVTTQSHSVTLRNVVVRHGRRRCRQWTYEDLFRASSIPSGTWIFTDHERLSDYEQAFAAHIATKLENEGSRVLNHPALVRNRFEILRRFKEAGINSFSAMRCESSPRPSRFPVFIRNTYDHESPNSTLIENQEDLDAELVQMERRGIPLNGKLVIEYAGEELAPGVWARLSTYRIADKTIAHHMAFDHSWIVKDGFNKEAMENHPEKDRFLDLERNFVTQNLYADVLAKAFALARIEYGRADFSIVNNRVQIYEINTNPYHGALTTILREAHPQRCEVQRQSEDELQNAIVRLDQAGGNRIEIGATLRQRMLQKIKRRYWAGVRVVWRP